MDLQGAVPSEMGSAHGRRQCLGASEHQMGFSRDRCNPKVSAEPVVDTESVIRRVINTWSDADRRSRHT